MLSAKIKAFVRSSAWLFAWQSTQSALKTVSFEKAKPAKRQNPPRVWQSGKNAGSHAHNATLGVIFASCRFYCFSLAINRMHVPKTLPLLFFFLFSFAAYAGGGIRGSIKNAKGEPLPFASIMVKNAPNGTMANEDGKYEIALPPGTYEVVFQYLGHKTLTQRVETGTEYVTLDVVLEEQAITLSEVKVSGDGEDPAYTIMRKAISMARLHLLEVDAYTARTYVKGSGKVKEVSGIIKWAAGKKIEKETGLKIGQTYVLESINDISFRQPNTVKEKIVSNRDNFPAQLKANGGAIISFANINFYKSKAFGGLVSPLSTSAFAYYRFKYEGFFNDRGVQVNKIRVVPKAKSEYVFDGIINIMDGSWAIHSLDLNFGDNNGKYHIKQLYSPFKDVWMPVYYEFNGDFNAFGVEAGARYVTNVRNYNVTVNPKYHQQPVVVDEKIDRAEAAALQSKKIDAAQALAQQQLTRKQLKKTLRRLEKEEVKAKKAGGEDVSVANDYSIEIDTLAAKRSNDFWNAERQVPLTEIEVKGYAQADSTSKTEAEKIKKDSLRNLPNFKIKHLFFGHTYSYGKRDRIYGAPRRLTLTMPLSGGNLLGNFYNSVEGYYLNAGLKYARYNQTESRLELNSDFRYSFARQQLNGIVGFDYRFGKLENLLGVSAGRFVQQINGQNPISPFMNTFYSLLLEENYMKLYERSFVQLRANKFFNEQFRLLSNLEFAQRNPLANNHFAPWIDNKEKVYSSNNPVNIELPDTQFSTHNTLLLNLELQVRPFAKAGKFNGRTYTINRNKPAFFVRGKAGLLAESRFSQAEIAYDQTWELQKLGDLHVNAKFGGFFNRPQYFIDYKHFNGNQTIFSLGSFESFRNLDYYTFSTARNYLEIHANNDFQRFLLTRIVPLRLAGLKENVFANYFNAFGQRGRYLEVGYGLTGGTTTLGLGLEVIGSFFNERYRGTVLRVRIPF